MNVCIGKPLRQHRLR